MQDFQEQLLPGQFGHLLIVLSFVAALLASVSYFIATQRRAQGDFESWRNIGRFAFLLHGLAVLGVIACLFYILVEKRYEYQYAWANVSDDLPFKYTFSAFWKEQQGSFLLWSFWHVVLGLILMLRAGKWETPVLAVIALAEAFIGSMILGLYFGDARFGASPFDLLRDISDAPIFEQKDYLTKIKGNGLNPLLQNYWMTIHPPTLFLGFASTLVPFSYALAGLWTREHKAWLKPALPWALFSAAILGTGILMGGAWAYEALSFGGYWAWDPVENTSLVPWIILVAGVHTHMVARATGYSIRSTYAFYLLTFIFILYSTYLTRSGILGDTSAHAFTEMGLGLQLVLFILAFTLLGFIPWLIRYKEVPQTAGEEGSVTREFWMFIGSLVLLFSAILITGATSLPVWNKIVQAFDPSYTGAALRDPVEHHNRYQLFIGVCIGLLSGCAQFLRYGERNWKSHLPKFYLHLSISVVAALLLTALSAQWINANAWQYVLLLFSGAFAITSNIDYLVAFIRGNLKLAASTVAHLGFGILILGILSTGLNKEFLSVNSFAMEGLIEGADDQINRNVILLKEAPMPMRANLEATYERDTLDRQTRTFQVRFKERDAQGNPTGQEFVLTPNVMYDREFSKVVASNPSTKHYWDRDIFTHVTSLPKAELDPEYARQQEDSLKFTAYEARIGDTLFTKKHFLVVEGLTKQPNHPDYRPAPGDLAFGLQLRAYALGDTQGYRLQPAMYLRPGEGGFTLPATASKLQMKVRLTESSMERLFKLEDALQYTGFPVKEGQTFQYKGYSVQLSSLSREIKHPTYVPEDGDLAVAAALTVTAPDGRTAQAAPVYLIRGNQPFSLKDEAPAFGLHFRFDNIDPKAGILTISAAQAPAELRTVPLEIAENTPRGDYIVLEAILFPGINLVWAGSILMLLGLAMGMWRRASLRSE